MQRTHTELGLFHKPCGWNPEFQFRPRVFRESETVRSGDFA
jgi:hypothetical protein